MKTKERQEACHLRSAEGLSIKEIASLVGVARSTVSVWVRDIELTAEQLLALSQRHRIAQAQLIGARANAERARERRRAYQEHGRTLARRGDALHVAGSMLYWAEGDKHSKNSARLANSDPELVRLFVQFVRATFAIEADRFRVTCHLFADHLARQRAIEGYWLSVLGLHERSLCRSIVNVYSKYSQKKRTNRLPMGTCHVAVHDTRVVQSIFGAIQEYGGFDRPEWLG
jgi:transcriptional regulator with XRE-family HTH domain